MPLSAALHHLQHLVQRFGEHLLGDFPQRLLVVFELAHELGEQREVGFLEVRGHGGEPTVHRPHEPLVSGHDQPVDVGQRRALAHDASIARRIPSGNATGGRPRRALAAGFSLALAAVAGPARGGAPPLGERVTVSGWLDGRAVLDTGGGRRQRPQVIGRVGVDAALSRRVRARATLRARAGGPFEGGSGACVYDGSRTFQNCSPAFEAVEGWLEWRSPRLEVRGGLQQLAWGRLDGVPPTDLINPRDYHDPLLDEPEDRKIGIGALLATVYPPDVVRFDARELRLQLLWAPFAVPPRLPLIAERWFPGATRVPERVRLPPAIGGIPLPDRSIRLAEFATVNDGPPRTVAAGGVGVRAGGTVARADWDVYHYSGPATAPYTRLEATLFAREGGATPDLVAVARLGQQSGRVHLTGADVAAPLGDFTVRGELAWLIDQPVLRAAGAVLAPDALARLPVRRILRQVARGLPADVPLEPVFPRLDLVEWGAGIDTVWRGWQPLLQVNQIVPLEHAPGLLIANPETRLTALLRRRALDDRLELELRTLWALEKGAWVVFPRVSWLVADDIRLRVGYLAIGGPRRSVIGQFKANDAVVFQARWSF